jgi:hypothetical protein
MIMMTSQIFAGNAYYVDASQGNDLNDGLSPAKAWKTLSKVTGEIFSLGDSILLKRGEVWREHLVIPSSGTAGNPIIFGAYGSGDKPIINGAYVETGWEWDSYYVYKKSFTNEPRIVVEDDIFLIFLKWQGSVSSTFSSASAGCWAENNNTAYLWCTDNADPDTHTMEVAAKSGESRRSIHSEGKSHFTIQDLDIRNSTLDGIKVDADTNVSVSGITIQRCTVSRNGGQGILVQNWHNKTGGYPITDILVDDNIVYESRKHGIEFVWDVQNSKISNNTVYRNGWDQDAGYHGISTYADSSDEAPPNNNVIQYNIVYETQNPTGTEGTGIQFDDYTKNSVMRYNKTYNNEGPGIVFNITNNCQCYYNISYKNAYMGFNSNYSNNIYIYNNVFSNNQNFGLSLFGTCNNFAVKNNIIVENNSYEVYVDSQSGTYIGDYNCIYHSAGGNFMYWKGGDYSWSGWKTYSGQDSNSKNQDPLFLDATNADFKIQPTSLCIDAGTNVSLTEDYAGHAVPYGLGVDIGVYEYVIEFSLTIETSTGGTTDPSPEVYFHLDGTEVQVEAIPDNGYRFTNWSGDASGTSNPITITMNSDKSITANFTFTLTEGESGGKGGKKGCFIATAAYDSPLHPYLGILRDFRDKYLMPSKLGRTLVCLYYKYCPYVANLIAKHKVLKNAIRISILPLVAFSYSMVHFGPIITGVILVSIFVLHVFLILFLRTKIIKISRKVLFCSYRWFVYEETASNRGDCNFRKR